LRTAIVVIALVASVGRAEAPQLVTIAGQVFAASGAHPVHVALWDGEGFLRKPVKEVRLPPETTRFQFAVKPGRWAVSAYEDRNENGVLDMGLFGPKEPSGFWRAFNKWHKPRFEEVASDVDHDIANANVSLR
jgi:uncharacterized protein (DUF2141 family)